MYENGDKKGINIDFPSFDTSKFKKNKNNNTERRLKISGTVIPKLCILAIFFFLFIFCISKYGTVVAKDVIMDEDTFNSDITYIQKQSIAYYKDGRIPKISGETSTVTLDKLIKDDIVDMKKIKSFKDCNLKNSTVKLTLNHNNTYKIVISIDCDGLLQETEETLKKL